MTVLFTLAFASLFLRGLSVEYSIPELYTSLDNSAINIGPLTTTFTPAPSCTSVRFRNDAGWLQYEMGCEGPGGDDCCPPNWRAGVYYSPGMCPSGYRAFPLMTTAPRAETTNMCCPDGYDLGGARSWCTRRLNTRTTLSLVEPTTTRTQVAYAVTATAIQIRFKETDSSVVPIPSHPIRIPDYYIVDPDKKKSSSSDDDFDPDMPTKVKVGIAFGVIGVALVIFALVVCCCRRKKVAIPAGNSVPPLQQPEQAPLRVDSDPPPAYPGYPSAGSSTDPSYVPGK